MSVTAEGLIIKAISGAFYVRTEDAILPCKARGIFRKRGIAPLAGDHVRIEDDNIVEILPRKNELVRPRAANIDLALMTVSTVQPEPNAFVLDKLLTVCAYKDIEPIIILTKTDLKEDDAFADIYRKAGFTVILTGEGIDSREEILQQMKDKVSIFIGNSGVGKSTLLNRLFPDLELRTAAISNKLGRGRHTTRQVELYPLPGGGYVADSPGFSTVELEQYEPIRKEELQYCFREFAPYLDDCKFVGCSHRKEKGCAVLAALQEGKISSSRHESYVTLYEEAMKIPDWQREEHK
jgi:ribosome biogenesis GTPase